MNEAVFDCDCDCVIDMQRMGIGVEEILQYAKSVLTRSDLRALLDCFETLLAEQSR